MSDGTITDTKLSKNVLTLIGEIDDDEVYVYPLLDKEVREAPLDEGEKLADEMDHGVSYYNEYVNITIQFDAGENTAILQIDRSKDTPTSEYTSSGEVAKNLIEQLEKQVKTKTTKGGKSRKLRRKSRKTKTTRRRKTVSRRR